MNKATFTGRLTKDAIIKTGVDAQGNNWSRCTFTLAVKDGKDPSGNPNVDYIPCVFWGSVGETLARYNHKGDKIMVTGKIKVKNNVTPDGKTLTSYTYLSGEEFEYMQRKLNSEEEAKLNEAVKSVPEAKPVSKPASPATTAPKLSGTSAYSKGVSAPAAPEAKAVPAASTPVPEELSYEDYSEIEDFIIPAFKEPIN